VFKLSRVDPGSLAEQAGFRVGDQILDVNGRSFENVKHKEAADFIKSNKHIIVTLKVSKSIFSSCQSFLLQCLFGCPLPTLS
jgi:C-terminal processing protease CtpA/Prc